MRPKQQLPGQIISDLLKAIRAQFYPDSLTTDKAALKQWAQDFHFLRRNVVLWPATWLDKRGITLKPERYKAILLEVFNEIKTHGQTAVVKYWPGYLAKCVQERFKHRCDDIYQEGKNLRAQLEHALTVAGHAKTEIDPIRALAETRRDLLRPRNTSKKARATPPDQLSLL